MHSPSSAQHGLVQLDLATMSSGPVKLNLGTTMYARLLDACERRFPGDVVICVGWLACFQFFEEPGGSCIRGKLASEASQLTRDKCRTFPHFCAPLLCSVATLHHEILIRFS